MKKNPVSRYLNEIIDYGGIPTTRGEVISDMQSMGMDQPCIDRWLQGQEFMDRLRKRREPITVRLFLSEKDSSGSSSQYERTDRTSYAPHPVHKSPQTDHTFFAVFLPSNPKQHPKKPKPNP